MERLYVLSLVYSLMLTVMYGVGQLNLDFMKFSSNALFPATSAVACAASFLTLKRYAGGNSKSQFSAAWMGFSSGVILWFLGDLTWAVYVLYLAVKPFPSVADVFYLSGYGFLFLSLFLILKLFKPSSFRKIGAVSAGITVPLAVAVLYLLLIPIFSSGEGVLATVLAVSYPILDIGLFALAFSILLIFLGGSVGKAWFFLTMGIILNVGADLFFSYAELQGFYYEGNPFELFWLWGYIAFILGFYVHWREL